MGEVGWDGDPVIFEDCFKDLLKAILKSSLLGEWHLETLGLNWSTGIQPLTNLLEFFEDITAVIDKENSNLIRFSEDS